MDVFSGIVTVIVLTLVSVPVLQWVARREGDPALFRMLMTALAAKVVFTLIRYFVIAILYNDNADAGIYSAGAAQVVDMIRDGIWTLNSPFLASRGAETQRIGSVVAIVYLITGVSRYAASFVFSWICFTGQVLMWRAFRRAVPEGDQKRYAMLVLFLPSLLFWPSSIGKEALMIGAVGVASYGAAQILGQRVRLSGVLTFVAGAAGLMLIRPHMALIAIVSLGFASAVGTIAGFRDRTSSRAFAVRVIALAVLIAAASVATTRLSQFFGDDGSNGKSGIAAVLDRTKSQTGMGGSEFTPPAVTSPLQLPFAAITVLFRPFPYEARSANGLIASAEGVILLGLFVAGRRRILTWFKLAPQRPYLVFAATYAVVFIVAFSYIGNFGILARQRTQMLPLVVTVISMYPAPRTHRSLFGFRAPDEQDEDLVEPHSGSFSGQHHFDEPVSSTDR